ncbi:hypothetical protein D3C81_2058270 [compost metagenome]
MSLQLEVVDCAHYSVETGKRPWMYRLSAKCIGVTSRADADPLRIREQSELVICFGLIECGFECATVDA